MLRLIDTDFSSSFGWHQASIWGLEEPEAYLHHELAFNVGQLLAEFSSHDRFQVLVTTHSPTMMAFGDLGVLVQDSTITTHRVAELIHESAAAGVGPYVHPLLINESKPLLLVEGKTDREHLENAYSAFSRVKPWTILATADLDLPEGATGFKHLLNQHFRPLGARNSGSPVVVLLDHDQSTHQTQQIHERLGGIHPASSAHRWDPNLANPDLDTSEFRGIEAFLSTALLEQGEADKLIRLMRPAAGVPIGCRDVDKSGLAQLGRVRLEAADYAFFEPILDYLESHLTAQPMIAPVPIA